MSNNTFKPTHRLRISSITDGSEFGKDLLPDSDPLIGKMFEVEVRENAKGGKDLFTKDDILLGKTNPSFTIPASGDTTD